MYVTLEKVIAQMERQEKFCWSLYVRNGGGKQLVAKFPSRGKEEESDTGKGEINAVASVETLRETVEDFGDDGEVKFEISFKRTPKSNGEEVSTWHFKAGQQGYGGGGGGFQGLGAIGQMFPMLQAGSQHQRELLEVIAEKKLLEYKADQLKQREADFEEEMKRRRKEFEDETKELRQRWESHKEAWKEGFAEVGPEAIKGVVSAFTGKAAPEAKPLAGAEPEKEEQVTAEQAVIMGTADWLNENVKNIYELRQIQAALQSPAIRGTATHLAVEVPNEAALMKIQQAVVSMVARMKENS